ncbi:MAG: gliding motility-associated C-terminal domain-containing protein [Bacteroidetes bacterium]|nr:gliding motility-associated C-terminal domain-containing protein [Bacteroidota bacterium]
MYSNKKSDTIQFRKGGKYIIHHRINNPPLNCPTEYFDTLVVPPLLEVDLALGPDTFVCAGTTLRLGARAANGLPAFKYKWFTPDSFNTKDTLTYLDVFMSTHDTTFRVLITDKNKCTAFDTVNVFLKPNPKVDMGPDLRICWYNSVTVIPNASNAYWIDPNNGDTLAQGDTLWWQWKHNGTDFSTDTIASFAAKGVYNVTVTDSLGCTWTDTMNLFVNDTIKPDAGPDQIKCFNDTLVLTAKGLDTMGNNKVGTYIWWKDIPIALPEFSRKQVLKFLAKTTTTYVLEVRTKEDTTQCFAYDTTLVTVNQLPVLTLIPPQKYCCDYGNIALGSSTFASPTGGEWQCRQVPAYVSSNTFLTNDACDPTKAGVFTLIYTYQDPGTLCINKDSTRFTINPLPPLQLKGGYYCQDKIEAPLKPHILAPLNLNSMVQANWRLLKTLPKPGGGNNTINDLVYDADGSMNFDFRLKVDKGTIDLGSADRDSIILELTIQDGEGCYNKDTVTIYIWKIPVITFNAFPDLCIDEGVVNLIKLSNTKPDDGYWTVINKTGYCDSARLRVGLTAPDTLNTNKLSPQLGPCTYWMRYIHTSSGCPVQKDTMLRINPLPNVNISITPTGNNGRFCEIDPDVTLNASPAGGTWTSSVAGVLGAGVFKPTAVQAADRDKWITLTYTYIHPTTKCDTAKSLRVFVQSKPVIDIVTPDKDTCRSNVMNFNLTATYAFTSKINWVHSAGAIRGDFASQQLSNSNPVTYTLRPRGDSATKVVVTAYTEAEGECPFASDFMIIDVNPVPHATVAIDDPDGCQPHTANFTTTITNGINPTTATYQWDFGDTGTGDTQDATHTFNTVGTNDVKLKITSDKGCDTTIGPMKIDVYPNPVADFTPNPNNSTTAALPRFRFTDQTQLQSVLGSKLVNHYWDFGDINVTTDTSTQTNPEYYYTSDTGTYYVTHTVVTNHGCRDSITKPVIIGPDILVYIPNVFSPDGAGPLKNDKFLVVASGYTTYQIMIFDRWGEVLYKSDKLEEPWDGNYKGVPCQMDAYVYCVCVSGKYYKFQWRTLQV